MFEQATATFDQRHRGFFDSSDEARQVWALDATRHQIVYLPEDGVDDSVRQACRHGRLRCPITRCPDPRLIAKGGTERRHHFAHKVAHTRHDSAAIFRTEAIAMLAAWARRYRGAQISTRENDAAAILSVRSTITGKAAEIAVTYNPRHDSAQTAAPNRQLLVGHTRVLLLPRSEHPQLPGAWCCGAPRLVSELIDEHGGALAVNPERQLVATLLSTRVAERVGLAPKSASSHPTICLVNTIGECRLDEHGTLTTPPLRTLRAWEQQHGPIGPRRQPHRDRRRTAKPGRAARSTPASTIGVDALPAAPSVGPPRPHRLDINRVIISGRLTRTAANAAAYRPRWLLTVPATDRHTLELPLDVELPAGTAPATGQHGAVIAGRLTSRADGQIVLVADTLQHYTTPIRDSPAAEQAQAN